MDIKTGRRPRQRGPQINVQVPNVTLFRVYDAVEYVIRRWNHRAARTASTPDNKRPRKLFDFIADNNAANAGVVMGRRPVNRQLDLRWIGAILSRNAR